MPARFDYYAPTSLGEAVELLDRHGEEARVLAGGQSLIPLMKLRVGEPLGVLVDLNRIEDLGYVKEEDGALRIGALARHRDLEDAEIVQERYPLLADAARTIGDVQVRNLGTPAGSLAHADPASDWGAAFLAFESEVVATSAKGERTIGLDDFFVDTFTTALEPGEVLTEIRVPSVGNGSGGSYMKLKRRAGDFAVIGVAAQLQLDGNETVSQAGLALTAVGAVPFRAHEAEDRLLDGPADEAAVAEAAGLAAQAAEPTDDLRGSSEYKRAMVEVFARRALETALKRARGGS